jgi:hypothetical protein
MSAWCLRSSSVVRPSSFSFSLYEVPFRPEIAATALCWIFSKTALSASSVQFERILPGSNARWTVINPVVILSLKNVYLVILSFYGKSSKMSQKREGIYEFSVENGVGALGNGMKLAKK